MLYLSTKQIVKPVVLLVLCFYGMGCSSTRVHTQDRYGKVWDEVVRSTEWNASLDPSPAETAPLPSAIPEPDLLETRYDQLIYQAYFRIIKEAEEVDPKIREAYERLHLSEGLEKTRALAQQRYRAHKLMLEGLRSWKAFDENSTADLEYFKKDNRDMVLDMLRNGGRDETIIRYLMRQLADLFHKHETQFIVRAG